MAEEFGLGQLMARWEIVEGRDVGEQIDALLEPAYAAGWLPHGHESVDAILLGEQYHLGGAEDTRRMAEVAGVSGADRVVDLACYIGGPARQLARDYGAEVVGVDISPVHVEVAEALTRLTGLGDRVRFVCASAEAVPEPDGSFTVAWSQCSFPADLSWLVEMDRLLAPGGRLAFTGVIRRSAASDPELPSLEEMAERAAGLGYRIICAEDISEMDLEHGWLPARRKLEENEAHYRRMMGPDWVRRAYESLDRDIEEWRSGKMGNGRIVAVK